MRQKISYRSQDQYRIKKCEQQFVDDKNFQIKHMELIDEIKQDKQSSNNPFFGIIIILVLSIGGIIFGVYLGSVNHSQVENIEHNKELSINLIKSNKRIGVLKRQKQSYLREILQNFNTKNFIKLRSYDDFTTKTQKQQQQKGYSSNLRIVNNLT